MTSTTRRAVLILGSLVAARVTDSTGIDLFAEAK